MRIVSPALNGGGRAWRPYRFPQLERVSRAATRLVDRLEGLVVGEASPAKTVESRLSELFDEQVQLVQDQVHVMSDGQLTRSLPSPALVALLSHAPNRPRALLEIELALAHAAVDKLLGGAGEAVPLRPLTDIEEGVMGYVLLEALRVVAPSLDGALTQIRLEGFLHKGQDASGFIADEQHWAVLQLRAQLGGQAGHVRLCVPASLLGMAPPSKDGTAARARRRALVQRNLVRLKLVRTSLRVEIGRAQITGRDLRGLGQGDVVLLDELTAHPDKPGGTARVRVGLGAAGRIEAEVIHEAGRVRVRLTQFVMGQEATSSVEDEEAVEEAARALAAGQPPVEDEATSEQDEEGDGDGAGEDDDEEYEEEDDEEGEDDEGSPDYDELDDDDDPLTDPGIGPDPLADAQDERTSADSAVRRPPARRSAVAENSEGSELLGDIPLQISVELGRVAVTAEDVVALRVGQVIDLNRVPGEPLDLSVNGKVVARGELVEVEGQLGVRVTALAG
jgi:flagellar motor switch protein FliM